MKILVTGASGFLGSHLVTRLAQEGHEVRALVRPTSQTEHLPQANVTLTYGDLKDRESLRQAVAGADIVYHAGAAMRGTWEEIEASTIRGTEWMLELSLAAGVKRFVHISSLAVYQVNHLARNATVDEVCPVEPMPEKVGPYAQAKVEAEKLAFRYHEMGLPVVVVRPGVVYGPRGIVLFPHIGYTVKNRLFVIVGSGANLLPLTYIDNTVDGLLLAAQSETAVGQVYTLVDEEEITQKEYLLRYLAAINANLFVLPMPFPLLLGVVGLVEQLRKVGILKKKATPSTYGLASKYKSLRFSAAKAREELGWVPEVSLDAGLQRTFDWYNELSRAQ
jgi:2-alkyl-3-oxoalkanoate reductase